MGEVHSRITNSIDVMISDAMLSLQYYGEFCQFINFRKYHAISTCGVSVNMQGMCFYYNEDFVNTLTQEEMNFIMLHEIFHLLWDHQARIRRCGYDKELSNVVQDMIINDVIRTDVIERMENSNKINKRNLKFAEPPTTKKTNRIWVLHKPEEYKGKLSYEEMYEWITIEKEKFDNWKKNCKCLRTRNCKCNHGKETCECDPCPVSDYLRSIFEQIEMGILDFLDSHLPGDCPEELRKSIIENVKNNLRNRGLESADVLATLDKITKSKKDYIKNIKIGINELFGTYKNKSITKRNRRSIPGVKGKKKDSYALNVMLDVSGSMEGYFEKALSYIFQNGIKINLIQCDAEVKDFMVVKSKSDFKKIEIKGLGGTAMQPGIDFISETKKINELNTLILTDGFCEDHLSTSKLKRVLIISVGKGVKTDDNAKVIVIKD